MNQNNKNWEDNNKFLLNAVLIFDLRKALTVLND